jgi:lipopolysaccharide transport system permease protein
VFLGLAFVIVLGIGFFLSALNVRYRDVAYAIPVFLQVLPFVSGVPYAVSEIPEKWQWILSLNPMTAVISGWRWTVLGAAAPDAGQVAVGAVFAFLLLLAGLAFFRSSEPRFADTI